MTTNDRRGVPLDDDRTLDDDDLEPDPDLAGHRDVDDGRTPTEPDPATDRATDRTNDRTDGGPLVAEDSAVDFRARWDVVQQGFVDDPRNAVSEADKLVDDVLQHLADGFDRQRQDLEQQWSNGEPSTEDLRSALQRYRAFFQRLLTL
ncbi:hypothetical protein EV651_11574 [Kribbella sp. VKM Ac-2571]|uniref:hypothetical protein n=1 Tax=Kribbella sp. VKM Ac-2571 TaxID=2512222 RepID=UPI00105DFD41|nr:hypothetical protein [Kribbella sp. VKM Ac-2571]TDO55110.1 hypothetical protein EV651_11574 [Kribbella sp. VKM Ac-2571]